MNDKAFIGSAAISPSYALFNPLDLYADEEYSKAIKTVPYMSSLSWLKMVKGRSSKRKVTRSEYSYYEEGQFMNAKATIAAVTPNGLKWDITLAAGDHLNLGGPGKTSFPVEGQTVVFQDGRTTGYVETKNETVDSAHVVTVKKLNASQDIGAQALVGSTMVFYSNAQPARGIGTQTRTPQFEKITNKMQIVREKFDTEDVELQNRLRFTTSSGQNYLWYKGIEDTMQRFEFQKETALLITPQSDLLTDKNGKPVQTAFGMLPQIDQHGINLEYFDSPEGATFDEVMLALDNNYAEKSYIVGHGMNVMLKLKDWLIKFGQNGTGNISFSPFDGGESQAIKLNFKSYSVGAWEFYFQQWSIFSHKDSLGAPGLPYRHMMVFIPAGNTKNPDPNKSSDSPDYEPYLQLVSPVWGRHPNIDKGEYLMWETGALAQPNPTNETMEQVVHMYSVISLEMRNRHKFAKLELA
ncbi:MAG: hypothetical protein WKF87_06820 [Chryseolinea sp.]